MLARRIARVVVALLTLNFGVASAQRACAKHDAPEQAAPVAATGHEHHQVAAPLASSEGMASEAPPCETPTPIECCAAMSSCGTSLDAGAADRGGLRPASTVIVAGISRAPVTQIFAPEPPPPRA